MPIANVDLFDQNSIQVQPHVELGYFLFQTGQLTVVVDMGTAINDPPVDCSIIPFGQTFGLAPDSNAAHSDPSDPNSGDKWDFIWNNVPNGCGQTLQVQELPDGADVCTLDLEVVVDINNPECPAPPPPPPVDDSTKPPRGIA